MIKIETCGTCGGTCRVPHAAAGTTYECIYCAGSGVQKVRGHGGYRTAAGAAKALRTGTGRKCVDCHGTGTCVRPDEAHCHSCYDGVVLTAAMPGDAWPEDAPRRVRYAMASDEVMTDYAAAVNVRVVAENRPGTWNEAHLGLGSVMSSTDYGRTWDALVKAAREDGDALTRATDAVRVKGRDALRGCQWVKLTREDDTLATDIVVRVHRNGYTVQAVNARAERVSLPPTYSEEILSRPV